MSSFHPALNPRVLTLSWSSLNPSVEIRLKELEEGRCCSVWNFAQGLKCKTDFHFANVAGFCVLVDFACMSVCGRAKVRWRRSFWKVEQVDQCRQRAATSSRRHPSWTVFVLAPRNTTPSCRSPHQTRPSVLLLGVSDCSTFWGSRCLLTESVSLYD